MDKELELVRSNSVSGSSQSVNALSIITLKRVYPVDYSVHRIKANNYSEYEGNFVKLRAKITLQNLIILNISVIPSSSSNSSPCKAYTPAWHTEWRQRVPESLVFRSSLLSATPRPITQAIIYLLKVMVVIIYLTTLVLHCEGTVVFYHLSWKTYIARLTCYIHTYLMILDIWFSPECVWSIRIIIYRWFLVRRRQRLQQPIINVKKYL